MKPKLPLIPPAEAVFRKDSFNRLRLSFGGRDFPDVHLVRSFPITAPGRMIAVLDAQGREVGFIDDIEALPEGPRQAAEEALAALYPATMVDRIRSVEAAGDVLRLSLETNRGPREAILQRTSLRPLPDGRVGFRDQGGIWFVVPRPEELDGDSRRLISEHF